MTILATAAALGLYALFAVPVLLAWRSQGLQPAAWLGAGIALLVVVQTGLFGAGEVPVLSQVSQDQMKAGRCEEMFALMVENRVLLEQPAEGRMVAGRALWEQMPEVVREAAITCAQANAEANPSGGEIEVILR